MTLQGLPEARVWLDLNFVKRLTGRSTTTIYRWVRDGYFPPKYKLGPHGVYWRRSEVEAWNQDPPKWTAEHAQKFSEERSNTSKVSPLPTYLQR